MVVSRLSAGDDLKQSICKLVTDNNLSSAVVVSAVGSLSVATIRMAGASPEGQDIRVYNGTFEIVSLTGTIGQNGQAHLHISISDTEGVVIGGHLKDGCIVHTTVEIALLTDEKLAFVRTVDNSTGFDELTVQERA